MCFNGLPPAETIHFWLCCAVLCCWDTIRTDAHNNLHCVCCCGEQSLVLSCAYVIHDYWAAEPMHSTSCHSANVPASSCITLACITHTISAADLVQLLCHSSAVKDVASLFLTLSCHEYSGICMAGDICHDLNCNCHDTWCVTRAGACHLYLKPQRRNRLQRAGQFPGGA